MQTVFRRSCGVAFCAALALAAAAVPAKAGEQYALLVAVQDYPKEQFNPLQYTRDDVLDFRQALLHSGFRDDHIVVLHDKQARRELLPEIKKIRKQLDALLAVAGPDDTLIVALSGHGVDVDRRSYFCPLDGEVGDKTTLLDLDDLYAKLKDCKAQRKLLLADCCRNDPLSKLNKSVRPEVDVPSLSRPQTRDVPEGVVALFSCSAGETSREDPDLKHGVFFYHVIKGWRGEAADKDGKVTLDGVVNYAVSETQTYVRVHYDAAVQRPQRKNEFSGEWVVNQTDDGKAVLKRGKALLDAHQYDDAIKTLAEAERLLPHEPLTHTYQARAFNDRGSAYRTKGDFDKAVADYTEAVHLDPEYVDAIGNRGLVLLLKEDYDKAIADFNEAIRLDPKRDSAFNGRGIAWKNKKDYDKAIADFNEAIRLNPKSANAFLNRGNAWADKKEYDKAIADFDESVRLDPMFADAFFNRGNAWGHKKEYDKAIADFDGAIRLNAKYALAFQHRGSAYRLKGDDDKAIADFDEAIRLNPKDALAFKFRGAAFRAKGDQKSADTDFAEYERLRDGK